MVMDYWGTSHDEEEIAIACRRDPDLGTDDVSLKTAAESYGFEVDSKNDASFNTVSGWLDKGVPPIVNWFTCGRPDHGNDEVADGHYSVVVGLDKANIYLQDPEIGGMRTLDRDDFMRVWFDFRTAFISGWDDMIIRQMIAVYPKSRPCGRTGAGSEQRHVSLRSTRLPLLASPTP